MSEITFTTTSNASGSVRHWDLAGPAGVVQFETADAGGFRTASIYLHSKTAPEGAELEPCDVCGGGWHDAAGSRFANGLRGRWEASGRDDDIVRAELVGWYESQLTSGGAS